MIAVEDSRRVAGLLADLVAEIGVALVHLRVHQGDHPNVDEAAAAASRQLFELGRHLGAESFRLTVDHGVLLLHDVPMIDASLAARPLAQALRAWRVGGVEVDRRTPPKDVRTLFELLRRRPQANTDHRLVNDKLARVECTTIRAVPPPIALAGHRDPDWFAELAASVEVYQRAHQLLADVTVSAACGGKLVFEPVHEVAAALARELVNPAGLAVSLGRFHRSDPFRHAHTVRVALLAMQTARALTKDQALVRRIGAAALLHDVGTALVPFDVLRAADPLEVDAGHELARHAELGARFLLEHSDVDPIAVAVAFGHHAGEPGRGYPRTRHGHDASLPTEIVELCDAYEVLTAPGPAMSATRAYRVMIAARGQHQRPLLRRFIERNGCFPRGSLVRLESGEIARVVGQGEDPRFPVVRVVMDGDAAPMFECGTRVVDLGAGEPKPQFCPIDESVDSELLRSSVQRQS